jgi:membrane-bound ClpP family serine protease
MYLPFILWILGLIFVLLEFYLPGIIMATFGIILLITSIFVFIVQSTSPLAIILYVVGVAVSLILLIRYTLKYIPRAKPGVSIYLSKDQEGYQASSFDASAIGKTGVVISDLKPAGYIMVEGKKHQAISVSGYLPQGTEVVVLKGEEESLIVKPKNIK